MVYVEVEVDDEDVVGLVAWPVVVAVVNAAAAMVALGGAATEPSSVDAIDAARLRLLLSLSDMDENQRNRLPF